MKLKIFISQPMKGKSNEEIQKRREEIKEECRRMFGAEQVEFVDSFFKNAPHDARPLWYLGEAIKKMSTANFAIFDEDWQNARGCRIEHECALQYGLGVFYSHGQYGNL